jgi:hypothetical protein
MVFVLGMCLSSDEGYGEVARWLAGWSRGGWRAGFRRQPALGWQVPGTSALARARRRVGPQPFDLLFWWLASPLAGLGTAADPGVRTRVRARVSGPATGLLLPLAGRSPGGVAHFDPLIVLFAYKQIVRPSAFGRPGMWSEGYLLSDLIGGYRIAKRR